MDTDTILKEIGHLGLYQRKIFVHLLLPILIFTLSTYGYIYTARIPLFRCFVAECETTREHNFAPTWLQYSRPQQGRFQSSCRRYTAQHPEYRSNCTAASFTNQTFECHQFVFENKLHTVAMHYHLLCNSDEWKSGLVGTVNHLGILLGAAILGFLSDRYGRRNIVICSSLTATTAGLTKLLSPDFTLFLILEFIGSMAASGIYIGALLILLESVIAEKRGLVNSILSVMCSCAGILMVGIMWLLHDWQLYLFTTFFPGLLGFFLFWSIPESLRWLLAHKRYDEAIQLIMIIKAKNKKLLSERTKLQLLALRDQGKVKQEMHKGNNGGALGRRAFSMSSKLTIRLFSCCFCWFSLGLAYYVVALWNGAMREDAYLGYTVARLVEVPAAFLVWPIANCCGRRFTMAPLFFGSGIAAITAVCLPRDMSETALILLIFGKLCSSAAQTSMYLLTAEMFPTKARHFAMGVCFSFVALAFLIAHQIILLLGNMDVLLVVCGVLLVLSGKLSIFFPETVNKTLPDTVQNAECIGGPKALGPSPLNEEVPPVE